MLELEYESSTVQIWSRSRATLKADSSHIYGYIYDLWYFEIWFKSAIKKMVGWTVIIVWVILNWVAIYTICRRTLLRACWMGCGHYYSYSYVCIRLIDWYKFRCTKILYYAVSTKQNKHKSFLVTRIVTRIVSYSNFTWLEDGRAGANGKAARRNKER